MKKLFVYGTLTENKILNDLIGRIPLFEEDSILGWQKGCVTQDGKKYPAIYKTKNSTEEISGKILEVSEEELKILDKYEGKEYSRKKVKTSRGLKVNVYVKKYD